jgi:hypothetical protein
MCNERIGMQINHKVWRRDVDKCLIEEIDVINKTTPFRTVASCCGHNIYNRTILVTEKGRTKPVFDIFTNVIIPRNKKHGWYRKDSDGVYFIPEIEDDEIGVTLYDKQEKEEIPQ